MIKDVQEKLEILVADTLKLLDISCVVRDDIKDSFFLSSGFGELSTNLAFKLAGRLKQSPRTLAEAIAAELKKNYQAKIDVQYIQDVLAEGAGFINFYLSPDFFRQQLHKMLFQGRDYFRSDIGKSKKVLVEFVSANPTGPLSVAHARQAVVGDALANIFSFLNFDVTKEYYLNDEGNQINILGKSVELRIKELNGEKIEFPENYYQGEYIYDLARELKQKEFEAEDLAGFAAGKILAIIKEELKDFGVGFDSWYSQKSLRESGKITEVLESLKQKNFLYEQDQALWLRSTEFGDDKDRVVIKSDGSYTYLAPDIAYHEDKFKRGFQWLINLWGPDHHGYISRLKSSISACNRDSEALSVIIVQLATIFRDGKIIEMSTRKGQYITLREVLNEVGTDAARFFFLMRKTSSHLNFDLELAKKQTSENPVYYVQYAHARISSILRQGNIKNKDYSDTDFSLLKEKEELDLIRKLWTFTYMLEVCLKTLDPYMVTAYLQEVAELFHRFYDHHRVLTNDTLLSQARLSLIQATKNILAQGLSLLGVSLPDKM
ncbi:MAG: arginine--tRNA ligase [Candidatus Omnitrophota bacterium]